MLTDFTKIDADQAMLKKLAETAQKENYSTLQLNAIIGSLMGDGFISRPVTATAGAPMRWNQSWKQHEYNLHKHQLLLEHATREPVKRKNPGYGDYWSILTLKSSQTLRLLFEMTHPNNCKEKTITAKLLTMITHPVALAWWFMDDGSRPTGVNCAQIATNSFTLEENQLLQSWLRERWGLHVSVHKVYHSSTNKEAYILYFPKKSYILLSEMISEYVPESMRYKVELSKANCALCNAEMIKSQHKFCSPACAQAYRQMHRKELTEEQRLQRNEKNRQWKAANRERVRDTARAYYQNMSPERREKLAQQSRAYREKNRDTINQKKREWRAAHKDDPVYKAKKAADDRAFREKLKQDPERLAAYKEKKSEYQKVHDKIPEVHARQMELQRIRRQKVRENPEEHARILERDRQTAAKREAAWSDERRLEELEKDRERARAYRQKVAADPEKAAKAREYAREYARKKAAALTPEEREARNAKDRERRAKKALAEDRVPKSRGPYKLKKNQTQSEATQPELF